MWISTIHLTCNSTVRLMATLVTYNPTNYLLYSVYHHQYIKDWKVEICRGGQSTVDLGRINNQHRGDQHCWSWGGQWSTWRGSTVNFHFCVKRQLPLLILGGGGEPINSQCGEGQQSTCTFARKGYHLCWWGGMDTPSDIPCVAWVGH